MRTVREVLLVGVTVMGLALVLGWTLGAGAQETTEPTGPGDEVAGGELFRRDCATCHGPAGGGTPRGPAIDRVGVGLVDYVLTTGRMPISHPDEESRRREPAYEPQGIADVVAHARTWMRAGPEVPEGLTVDDLAVLDLAEGGELYRRNCAVCHQLVGQGGALLEDVEAPGLGQSTATQVVEAIRAGPMSMPAFDTGTISEEEAATIAAYVQREIRAPTDPGGWGAGHLGPFAEGMVVWGVAIPGLLLACAWIGRRT